MPATRYGTFDFATAIAPLSSNFAIIASENLAILFAKIGDPYVVFMPAKSLQSITGMYTA